MMSGQSDEGSVDVKVEAGSTTTHEPSEKSQDGRSPEPPSDSEKLRKIIEACSRRDVCRLSELAVMEGGFISDELRSRAWPVLLGFNEDVVEHGMKSELDRAVPDDARQRNEPWHELPRHRDEDQVRLDVDRSFVYYPNDDSQSGLETKKIELSELITEVLRRQPWLCYFQGYHDICQVFLLVLPKPLRAPAVARLSGLRIRDFMLPNLAPSLIHLKLIPELLYAVDPKLCRHLSTTEPYFALSDTLTMFAHNIQRYSDIARLFDVLLAREQVFTIYIFAQIVLDRREELFDLDEPDMLHFTLSKLPSNLDIDAVIIEAAGLFAKHPPESLRGWRSVPRASVLKTARDVRASAAQSLEDGKALFDQQLRDLHWAEKMRTISSYDTWQNRTAVLTLLVGVAAAVYLRSKGTASGGGGLGILTDWL
ncbi:rab-GTPase-TBC domain-containing protein [Microdochium trichocladiopsis]|uniref:Rab-GTPase-TBC domain-containing protein n=1 Tax=Microdochium trichocladiopsis TaxID=1682393 RepID=A0A9P8Y910_9PEZI|nr:rab-GTPase-TBC domain-containing protein [Microdochium trichocladiopsis]KAH7031004.1 rab-GTPase-TBC domain-containing protein [Microdochium trichocladiopsis]